MSGPPPVGTSVSSTLRSDVICVRDAAFLQQTKMLRSLALALVAAASTEAFMAPAAWTSTPVSNRAVAKSGLSSLEMKVRRLAAPWTIDG